MKVMGGKDEGFSVCGFECTIHSYFRFYLMKIILDSSMVEHSAVNRGVVGSSPTRGVFLYDRVTNYGSMVKRLRHRPFTAVTGVQIPLESF